MVIWPKTSELLGDKKESWRTDGGKPKTKVLTCPRALCWSNAYDKLEDGVRMGEELVRQ